MPSLFPYIISIVISEIQPLNRVDRVSVDMRHANVPRKEFEL